MRRKRFSPNGQRGLALVTTLLVTAILVAMISEFVFTVFIQTSRVQGFRDSSRAALLAEDGVTIGRSALAALLGRRPNLAMDESGLVFSQTIGEGLKVDVTVFDESARISTRVVYTNTGVANKTVDEMFARLLKVTGNDERLKDALADWIDNDGSPRRHGAEAADYYGRLPRPYEPSNRYLRSVDELLMVKGFSAGVFGSVARFVTVYSADGLVNINTAPREVLMSLSDGMTGELAGRVIEYRRETPFKDRSGIMKVPGFETIGFALQDRITTQSQVYRIFSRASAGEAVREVEAVVRIGAGVLYWRES